MPWEAWLTLTVIVLVLIGLVRNIASPVAVLFGGLAVLMTATELTGTTRLLSASEAVAGFGNTGLVTVGLLFIVVAGLVHTGAVTRFATPLLGRPTRLLTAQVRLLLPVATLSAFMNNTPIVAMFLPVVDDLCKRTRLPPSRLFLPLSYASIFGGTCTLIGTSTNLVVDGLVRSQAHLPGLSLFDLAWVGVPVATVGLTYIFLFSARLLPDSEPAVDADADLRRYTVEVIVDPGGPMAGRTIEAAGLRSLPGLYLSEIDRNGQIIAAVGPREVLQNGDRLVFVGVLDSVVDLHRIRGLKPVTDAARKVEADPSRRSLVEAVVSNECPLVGMSIREGGFRGRYNAVVIAVARGARRLKGKIGDIVLQSGDVLLLETNDDFAERQRNARDFYLVSRVRNSAPRRHEKALVAVAALLGMVVLAATGILTMLNAALLAAGAMVLTGCATSREARRSIDWSVLLVIGAALGLGQAMANSGAAALLAARLIDLAGGHPWLVLLAVFVATSLFTEVITNNAAAVLMFPIALSAAHRLDVSLTPFVITLMIAASASFSTPLGYQTNLMVYGPGGYRFSDYFRFGLPLNVLTGVVTVALTPLIWPF